MKTKLSLFCDKVIEAGWLIAIVAVPLYFNIYTARTFEPDKITLLRSIVSIMILAWLISTVEKGLSDASDATPLFSRFQEWLKLPFVLPTLILVVAYIISTILSLSPNVSLWGSYQRLQGTYSMLSYITLFALIGSNLRTREQVDRMVTIAIIASIPVSLYGIVQKYGLDPLPWAGDVTTRVAANLGNAIFVASYLIMIMPLTLGRLIESMTAIIKEDKASWGHTILAAVYIFAFAIQTMTVLFSGSRGPMIGILIGLFIMGFLTIMTLRQLHPDSSRLSINEIVMGILFIIPLSLTSGLGLAFGGGLGYGLQKLFLSFNYQLTEVPIVGAGLGGLFGLLGLYTYMAVTEKGWRWLWLSWISLAVFGLGFILLLNMRDARIDPYMDPVRALPYIERFTTITQSKGGTGKVRTLIWEAAMNLVVPHKPLGVPGDPVSGEDKFNFVRPLVGYGPEGMFNAFAFVYPTGLAYIENRGSSADRSHNETMDSLVITGFIGFLAYYYIMISVFSYQLVWLGLAQSKLSKQILTALLILGAAAGGIIAYIAKGGPMFVPLGLPFGMTVGIILYLCGQGIVGQFQQGKNKPTISEYHWLYIGLLGAISAHFIEVHFVFSIVATYTYFWAYRGLMLALAQMEQQKLGDTAIMEDPMPAKNDVISAEVADPKPFERKRSRNKPATVGSVMLSKVRETARSTKISWQTVVSGYGLTMSIILIILTFDFITPQFKFDVADKDSMSLLWMYVITWGVGLAIALSDIAIRQDNWENKIYWERATAIYVVSSLSYFFFYYLLHQFQFGQQISVTSMADVIRAADVLVNGLLTLYISLLLLMSLFAIILSWREMQRFPLWRADNWWLYPPLIVAILMVIWFKNFNVVRADTYLKEGERYRNANQWEQAIALHNLALSIDDDEDFYYLMLALDYQLMAQDGKLDQVKRQQSWLEGERIALDARKINPYNPDNTGNMGRYYFTLGQVLSAEKFKDALAFFEKATILAPTNVIYHNLWAQTFYILKDYKSSVDRLKISTSIDTDYPPSWVLLGDSYAAQGNADEALKAHTHAMNLLVKDDGFAEFADQFLDQRLSFYISSGKLNEIVASVEQVALKRPTLAHAQWVIGHAYNLGGQRDKAIPYFEQAKALGDNSARTLKELGNVYLAQNVFTNSIVLYEAALQSAPQDVEAHSALAYMYAKQNNLDKAIEHNTVVLQQKPKDYDTLKNLSILYQQSQKWAEALATAQQAQAVAPKEEAASWDQFIANIKDLMTKKSGL